MKRINWVKMAAAIGISLGAGILGSAATTPKIQSWYVTLEKPFFSPPNWLFAPVWTLLFILIGISLYLVWNSKSKNKNEAMHWFGRQLGLNVLWSFLFFGIENPGLALIEIVIFWWAIWKTIKEFTKISQTAGRLLIPYFCWVSFATLLNGAVWWLNR